MLRRHVGEHLPRSRANAARSRRRDSTSAIHAKRFAFNLFRSVQSGAFSIVPGLPAHGSHGEVAVMKR